MSENTQKPTERNIYSVFFDKHNGMSNSGLAQKYGYSENTIKDYFATGGKWHIDFIKYASEINTEILKSTSDLFVKNATKATEKLVSLLDSKNENIVLKSSIEILNRTGIKTAEENYKLLAPNPLAEFVQEIREEIEEAKRAKELENKVNNEEESCSTE